MKRPDTPFPPWLYYIAIKLVVIGVAVLLAPYFVCDDIPVSGAISSIRPCATAPDQRRRLHAS